MNEQAQEVLAQMLQRVLDGVDSAVDFSQAQIPDVVEQLLMWHMVENFVWFSVGILVLFFSSLGMFKMVKKRKQIFNSEGAEFVFGFGGPVIFFGIVSGFALILSNLDWLKILIAPKLYLLEYAAELIK